MYALHTFFGGSFHLSQRPFFAKGAQVIVDVCGSRDERLKLGNCADAADVVE